MKAFMVSFTKTDGTLRQMIFARISDLPSSFISSKLKGTGKQKTISENRELVWDLEKNAFRVINYNTMIGGLVEFEFDENKLV